MNSTEAIIAAFSNWHPEAVRRAIRANFRCEYCDRHFLASLDDYKTLDEDHIIPTCAGGSEHGNNIAIACSMCNRMFKQTWDPRTVSEWRLDNGTVFMG
jgi:5-methylcytosine-specific restriction endonuclease McrA